MLRGDVLIQGRVVGAQEPAVHLPEPVLDFLVLGGPLGLAFQRAGLTLHFPYDVVDAVQVVLGRPELAEGLVSPGLVLHNPGRFFDDLPAVFHPGRQEGLDPPLLDDGKGMRVEPGVHEEVHDVAEAGGFLIDEVFAVAGAVEPSGHPDGVLDRPLGRQAA